MSKPSSGPPAVVELTSAELEELYHRLENSNLSDSDKHLFKGLMQAYIWLRHKYETGKVGLHKMATILFGNRSEKRGKRGKEKEVETPEGISETQNMMSIPASSPACDAASKTFLANANGIPAEQNKVKPKGHGRLGAGAYIDAEDITINHSTFKPGHLCPEICGGKLYSVDPGVVVRITGQDIAKVTRYHIQNLRCNTCGLLVKASLPPEVSPKKYNDRFKAILAVQKYFVGVPFFRQEAFQELMGFPLSDSTQWDLIEQLADSIHPIFNALEKQAAQAKVIYNDDTPVKIMEVMQLNKKDPTRKRKGMFTTGIYAQFDGSRAISLYYSGTRHAGENLSLILKHRSKDLPPVIHMSDALSANLTEFLVSRGTCMSHGRRKFIEIEMFFPEECRFVIDQFAVVYYNDDQAKKLELSGKERLVYHKVHSQPAMKKLKRWLDKQIEEERVEPNSGLGKAIEYLRRHWEGLTLFLRQADAPLDNNIVERALKIPIRLRKNSLVHRTCHGAHIASMLMSIIQTCRLCKINPVVYLTILQENKSAVFKNPDDWLPWHYGGMLQKKATLELVAA
jgi:transposase